MPKLAPIKVTSIQQLKRELAKAPWHQRFHAYKASMTDGSSIYNPHRVPHLICAPGKELIVPWANADEKQACATGVNVATRQWIFRALRRSRFVYDADNSIFNDKYDKYMLWLVEFRKGDVAAVPLKRVGRRTLATLSGGQGKFRLFRCKVLKQLKVKNVKRD